MARAVVLCSCGPMHPPQRARAPPFRRPEPPPAAHRLDRPSARHHLACDALENEAPLPDVGLERAQVCSAGGLHVDGLGGSLEALIWCDRRSARMRRSWWIHVRRLAGSALAPWWGLLDHLRIGAGVHAIAVGLTVGGIGCLASLPRRKLCRRPLLSARRHRERCGCLVRVARGPLLQPSPVLFMSRIASGSGSSSSSLDISRDVVKHALLLQAAFKPERGQSRTSRR